jgi:hypothetical protein
MKKSLMVAALLAMLIGVSGSGVQRDGPDASALMVYANGLVPVTNATGTPVVVARFRCDLSRLFPSGVVISVYADASGTAAGTCSIFNINSGSVESTAAIPTGSATIYDSPINPSTAGVFDYTVRFRVASGTGTISVYQVILREP